MNGEMNMRIPAADSSVTLQALNGAFRQLDSRTKTRNTETTLSDHLAAVDTTPAPAVARRVASSVTRAVLRIIGSMHRAYWERETAAELLQLSPDILRDIGLQGEDIRAVAREHAREQADAWVRQVRRSNGFGG